MMSSDNPVVPASLPPASEGWGKVIVSVCLFVHTRGGGEWPHLNPIIFLLVPWCPFWGGGGFTPSPSHNTSTGPMSFWGVPWGTPHPGMGYPPRYDNTSTGYAAGGMPLVVTQEDFLGYACNSPTRHEASHPKQLTQMCTFELNLWDMSFHVCMSSDTCQISHEIHAHQ